MKQNHRFKNEETLSQFSTRTEEIMLKGTTHSNNRTKTRKISILDQQKTKKHGFEWKSKAGSNKEAVQLGLCTVIRNSNTKRTITTFREDISGVYQYQDQVESSGFQQEMEYLVVRHTDPFVYFYRFGFSEKKGDRYSINFAYFPEDKIFLDDKSNYRGAAFHELSGFSLSFSDPDQSPLLTEFKFKVYFNPQSSTSLSIWIPSDEKLKEFKFKNVEMQEKIKPYFDGLYQRIDKACASQNGLSGKYEHYSASGYSLHTYIFEIKLKGKNQQMEQDQCSSIVVASSINKKDYFSYLSIGQNILSENRNSSSILMNQMSFAWGKKIALKYRKFTMNEQGEYEYGRCKIVKLNDDQNDRINRLLEIDEETVCNFIPELDFVKAILDNDEIIVAEYLRDLEERDRKEILKNPIHNKKESAMTLAAKYGAIDVFDTLAEYNKLIDFSQAESIFMGAIRHDQFEMIQHLVIRYKFQPTQLHLDWVKSLKNTITSRSDGSSPPNMGNLLEIEAFLSNQV